MVRFWNSLPFTYHKPVCATPISGNPRLNRPRYSVSDTYQQHTDQVQHSQIYTMSSVDDLLITRPLQALILAKDILSRHPHMEPILTRVVTSLHTPCRLNMPIRVIVNITPKGDYMYVRFFIHPLRNQISTSRYLVSR